MIERLSKEGESISFYRAIRFILSSQPGSVPPGQRGPFNKEPVLIRPNASLGFSARDIESIDFFDHKKSSLPDVFITVNFMGLYGPSSPLPAYFTEDILFAAADDSYVRKFLDIFNHRLLSYLYRSWEKYRYYIQYQAGANDMFSKKIFSLIGLEQAELRENSPVDWARLLPFVGILGLNTGSESVLRKVLTSYFGLAKVDIKQNIIQYVSIDESQKNSLGINNCTLSQDLSLGASVQDHMTKFRVCLSALTYARFKEFLPNGKHYQALKALVQFCIRDSLQFDVELVLMKSEIPPCVLSQSGQSQLGLSACLGTVQSDSISVLVT